MVVFVERRLRSGQISPVTQLGIFVEALCGISIWENRNADVTPTCTRGLAAPRTLWRFDGPGRSVRSRWGFGGLTQTVQGFHHLQDDV